MSILSKIINYWREQGFCALLHRVRQAIWHTEEYVILQKRVMNGVVDAQCDGVVFRVVDLAEADWLTQNWPAQFLYVGPNVHSAVTRRLEAGEIAVVGVDSADAEKLVCMIWLGFRDPAMLTVCGPEPAPERGCMKNLWTSPEYRRRGLARSIQTYMEAIAAQRGCHEFWAFVKPGNSASLHHFGRLEYEQQGKVLFLQRWGRRMVRLVRDGRAEVCPPCPPNASVL